MSQPGRWLWGLVPLALLWGAGNWVLDESIERDVTRRAVAAAVAVAGEAPGARPVTAQIDGRDVTISGEALSADGAARALARLRAEFGVRRALGGLSQVVPQRPYSWSAARQGEVVTLGGFVPDEETARALVAAAEKALPGAKVEDRQTFAFGAPTGFRTMAEATLAELPQLATGKVALDDTRFCLEGRATGPDAYLGLQAALGRLARDGFQAVPCSLEPSVISPYRWSIERLAGDVVRLEGFYPSDAVRQQVLALLRRAFPGPIVVDDRLKPGAGQPAAFLVKVGRALADLARLRQGKAELEGDTYRLSGEGPDTYAACQSLRLQIAQGDGPDSVAQATIACPPEPPPPIESLMPPLPAIPEPVFLPSDMPPPPPTPPPPPVESLMPPLPEIPAPIFLPSELPAPVPTPPPVEVAAPPPPVEIAAPPPPPPARALAWSAAIGKDGVALQGLVPDAATREALLARARGLTASGAVVDRMAVEANLRDAADYAAATGFALDLLGRLREGTVTLAGSALSLAGQVADGSAWAELDAALRRRPLPAGLSLVGEGAATVALRPYGLSISADRTGLSLSGHLPDVATREALRALVEASPLQGKMSDETQIVPGAPEGFAAAAIMAVTNLLRLDLGSAAIVDDLVTLRGLTCRDLIQREVETSGGTGLPPGFRADVSIGLRQTGCVVDPPATCQNDLDALTRNNTVLFAQGTSVVQLDAPTERVIAEAVAILAQCPTTRITIEGHANRDGERSGFNNLDLSARRALRVRDELVQRGIDPARLETLGFGSTRPLVPHGAPEARSMNRRVQFTVAK
ncbi:OmpA family protein [Bosea sp. R86505]|uniref:OmpA family protein n=1 Tax=Bosea sp. R86505 TaxID=3101710 RepID=UPI00366D2A7D